MAKKPSFNSAFAAARKSGKKEFSWNGKSYNTKLAKPGTPPQGKAVPKPASKPGTPPQGKAAPKPASKPKPIEESRSSRATKTSNTSVSAKTSKTPAKKETAPKKAIAIETGSRARNQAKAQASATKGTGPREAKRTVEKQDYPRPAKNVGIAKASSRIGQAAARQENKPKKKR